MIVLFYLGESPTGQSIFGNMFWVGILLCVLVVALLLAIFALIRRVKSPPAKVETLNKYY